MLMKMQMINYSTLMRMPRMNCSTNKPFSYLQYKTTSLIHEDNTNKEDLWITKH
jgi:hypothetical protein